jgi:hypothetical protein
MFAPFSRTPARASARARAMAFYPCQGHAVSPPLILVKRRTALPRRLRSRKWASLDQPLTDCPAVKPGFFAAELRNIKSQPTISASLVPDSCQRGPS